MAKMKATMAGLLNADKQEQKKLKAVCSLAMTASASLIYLLGLSQTLFCSLAISSVSPRCFTLFPHRWFLILAACLFFSPMGMSMLIFTLLVTHGYMHFHHVHLNICLQIQRHELLKHVDKQESRLVASSAVCACALWTSGCMQCARVHRFCGDRADRIWWLDQACSHTR